MLCLTLDTMQVPAAAAAFARKVSLLSVPLSLFQSVWHLQLLRTFFVVFFFF